MFSINLMLPTVPFITQSFIFSIEMQQNILSFILEYLTVSICKIQKPDPTVTIML